MHTALSQIDPSELTVHALAKRLPAWPKEDQRFIALVEDIRERGISQPIVVDAENRILDGREAWKAAKQLQLKTVPIVRTNDDPATVIVMGLALRKHYTKGALAYVVFPLLKPAFEGCRARSLANLKKGSVPTLTQSTSGKIEDFCEFLGFDRKLYYQAKEAHELFEKADKAVADFEAKHGSKAESIDLRAHWEPRLLNGDLGLGAMLAGMAGQEATKGKAREDSGQLSLFVDWVHETEVRFAKWDKLNDQEKNHLAPKIRGMVRAMPADLRKEFAKALKAASEAGE
jgi:hypothetical protein